MKYKLFEDMKKTIQLNPNAPHVLKIKEINKPFDIAIAYNGDGMMRIIVFKYNTRTVVKKSPWTNSYAVLRNYLIANRIKIFEYTE